MKHETFNSVVAVLGLALASLTAYYQFRPTADQIEIVNEGTIDKDEPVEVLADVIASPNHDRYPPRLDLVGPVHWKIRVRNLTAKRVAITSFHIDLQISDDGSPLSHPLMRPTLQTFGQTRETQSLPENIEPHETRAYVLSLFIPLVWDSGVKEACQSNSNLTLIKLEKCLAAEGADLFGNMVSFWSNLEDPAEWIAMVTSPASPTFILSLKTGDGTQFVNHFSYYESPFWPTDALPRL